MQRAGPIWVSRSKTQSHQEEPDVPFGLNQRDGLTAPRASDLAVANAEPEGMRAGYWRGRGIHIPARTIALVPRALCQRQQVELAWSCRLLGPQTLLVHLGSATSSDGSHPILPRFSTPHLGSLRSWVCWPAAASLVPTPVDLGVGHGRQG